MGIVEALEVVLVLHMCVPEVERRKHGASTRSWRRRRFDQQWRIEQRTTELSQKLKVASRILGTLTLRSKRNRENAHGTCPRARHSDTLQYDFNAASRRF
jgi:hypothetical protein